MNFKSVKTLISSIITDIKEGRFIMRRWHLHGLAFPLVILANLLMLHAHNIEATDLFLMAFRSLYETGLVGRFLLQSIIAGCISFGVEAVQGLMGANRTPDEMFESKKDMLFTFICFELGIILSLIFI